MTVLYAFLLFLGLICFVAAAFRVVTSRVELIPLGLALWILVPFIQTLRTL